MKKKCTKCGKVKELEEFAKSNRRKDGCASVCLGCKRNYYCEKREEILKKQRQYYLENRKEIREKGKIYYRKNKDKIYEAQKRYIKNNREIMLGCKQRYRERHREELRRKNREYYSKPEIHKQRQEYLSEFRKKENVKERVNNWFKRNQNKRRKYIREWTRDKYQNDPAYRIHNTFSSLLRLSLKKKGVQKKGFKAFSIVPYDKNQLMEHLEKQFKDGMTWENYGKWHIDHIVPRSCFQFKSFKDVDFQKCWALENLQPLWAEENLKKGNKILNKKK